MNEKVRELLQRQAEWQRRRSGLSWEEKLRLSLQMRETQRALRADRGKGLKPGDNPLPRA